MTAILKNKVEIVFVHQRLFERYHEWMVTELQQNVFFIHYVFGFTGFFDMTLGQRFDSNIFLSQLVLSEKDFTEGPLSDLLHYLIVFDRCHLRLRKR